MKHTSINVDKTVRLTIVAKKALDRVKMKWNEKRVFKTCLQWQKKLSGYLQNEFWIRTPIDGLFFHVTHFIFYAQLVLDRQVTHEFLQIFIHGILYIDIWTRGWYTQRIVDERKSWHAMTRLQYTFKWKSLNSLRISWSHRQITQK